MPITANTFEEFRVLMIEAATIAGLRFLKGDIPGKVKHTPAGWHDAWFDHSIPGYFKLNCFFEVPPIVFDAIKTTNWSPVSGKLCYKKPAYRPELHRMDKGMDGTVICNGLATPASMEVMGVIGSDQKKEHFETALYENRLYKPPLLNLEFKVVSDVIGNYGKPQEVFAINAHVSAH